MPIKGSPIDFIRFISLINPRLNLTIVQETRASIVCCKGTVDGCHWSWWTFKREFFFSLVLAARCGNAEDNGQAFGEACSTNGARLTRKSMNKTFDSNCSQFFELSIWFVVIRIFRSTVWKNCPLTPPPPTRLTQHFTLSEGLELPLGFGRGR